MTAAYISVAVDVDTRVEADVQEFNPRGKPQRLAFVYLHPADRAVTVAFRGTPEAMIAAFDQARDQLVKAVGEAWPVEVAHGEKPNGGVRCLG